MLISLINKRTQAFGVLHCLRQLTDLKEEPKSLDLSERPDLEHVGNQPVDLSRYERLLKYSW